MSEKLRRPPFIIDQRLSQLKLKPSDRGDKLKHLRAQDGGKAWEVDPDEKSGEQPNSRWHAIPNRLKFLTEIQSSERKLLTVTAYAGIGKSYVLRQIDGLLPAAMENFDVVRVEFSELPNDWMEYLEKPWSENSSESFLIKKFLDLFSKLRKTNKNLPAISVTDLKNWIEAKIRTGTLLLLVDGLDEFTDPSSVTKAKQLRHLLSVFPRLHCVVAGRPHSITQELWLPLFSDNPETESNESDWDFVKVEMFDRTQLDFYLGPELSKQLQYLEAEIELSARNLEALRSLPKKTIETLRSTAGVYWHSIVQALPRDNREGMGGRLVHTNLSVDEILQILSAIGATMLMWHDDPTVVSSPENFDSEFDSSVPLPKTAVSDKPVSDQAGAIAVGGQNRPMNEFKERLFQRLRRLGPDWSLIDPQSKRSLAEVRYDELIRLNSQYVEFSFLKERDARFLQWRNATLRDFFAALWYATRSNPEERIWLRKRIDHARDQNDTSIASVWRLVCGMPVEANRLCQGKDNKELNLTWLRLVNPLYSAQTDDTPFNGRPTELMFRAWPGLLYRAGFLKTLAWSEHVLLKATSHAQTFFDPKASDPTVSFIDENAWAIVGSFLRQYPKLRDAGGKIANIIHKDMEDQWSGCESKKGKKVIVGDGRDSDAAIHEEILKHQFEMCKIPVTKRLYRVFDPQHEDRFDNYKEYSPDDRCPAIYLNWYDSMMFSIWCHGYLPNEWEWEYASRAAGDRYKCLIPSAYYWGDDETLLDDHAWTSQNSGIVSHKVAEKTENHFELRDTLGNVWEWCRNRFNTEKKAFDDDSIDPGDAVLRVLRGGSFDYGAFYARCSYRVRSNLSNASSNFGCRVSRAKNP